MADDIVEQLESEHRMALAPIHMSDAADEIRRLRAKNDDLQVLLRGRTAELQAEIRRLQTLIANFVKSDDIFQWWPGKINDREIALNALYDEAHRD